jgi:PAS domain S-box-containing protein
LKILLLDDPIGSLTSVEDRLSDDGIEVSRVWDHAEVKERCSADHYDGIIASTVSLMGDAIKVCLDCKRVSSHPMMACLVAPYPIDKDDIDFLKRSGIDHVMQSPTDDAVSDVIKKLSAGDNGFSEVPEHVDGNRMSQIAHVTYELAVKDLAGKAKKLEEILENSSDVIYELDPYGRIILISKVIEKLTGYGRQELMGMSALDVVSSDSLEVVADHISMLLAGQPDPPAVEIGVLAKNGHIIPAEMIVRPIRRENQVVGILGIGRNVEERKRLEEGLKRVINEKDFYLDLMAHDLQNFNQAILGYLEMILATEGLDPKLERYAKGAFRQVMQTSQLIAHLKRVAQIRQFGTQHKTRRDLRESLMRSVMNIESRPDKHNVAITLECAEGAYPIMATDDLSDMLDLLVSAAARYSLSDLLHLKIAVSPEMSEGVRFWTVEISGKSLRLSKPVIRCVMSQDYTGCQTIERPDLQLLVVRAIIETMDGKIELKTTENGKGDRFVIRIPQA